MKPPVKIDMPDDLMDQVNKAVCERVRQSVQACTDRDDQFIQWSNQLEGAATYATKPRWKGASLIEDTITREHHLALLSGMMDPANRSPLIMVEAVDPADTDLAPDIEHWLEVKGHEYGLKDRIYDVAYNALRDPFAVMYVGWRQDIRDAYEVQYDSGDGIPVPEEMKGDEDDDKQYKEVLVRKGDIVDYDGPDIRVVDGADFYLFPPNAQDVTKALGCAERMWMTAEDLVDGIDEYHYDEEQVEELLRQGPTHYLADGEYRRIKDNRDGTNPPSGVDGDGLYFQIYQFVGRLPLLLGPDAEIKIPEHLRNVDFTWLVSVERDTVVRFTVLSVPRRPYFIFRVLPEPNRLAGKCVPQLLQSYQEEATANLRFIYDSFNLAASPVLRVPKAWMREYGNWTAFPGAVIPYSQNANEIAPLEWDKAAVVEGIGLQNDIRMRAREMISAQGFGQLTSKVRKAAEIDFAQAGVDQKFNLFYSNFLRPLEDVATFLIALYLDHMGQEGETLAFGQGSIQVTPDALRRRYRFIPRINTEDSNPQVRVQKATTKLQALRSSPLYQLYLSQGDFTLEYHAMKAFLESLGERDVVGWIGKEPPSPEQQQAMMQQGGMGGPMAQGPPGGTPPMPMMQQHPQLQPKVSVQMPLKDMTGSERSGIDQMIGLHPGVNNGNPMLNGNGVH